MNKEELKVMLIELSKRDCWSDDDDFNPYEFSGGNYDDAYYGGRDDGEAILAYKILKEFFKETP